MSLSHKSIRKTTFSEPATKLVLVYVKIFFILFYVLGAIGLLLPYTSSLFARLIPFALLLSTVALIGFHADRFDSKSLIIFFSIYCLSFFIEVIGVQTGLIFGEYQYGGSLGLKLWHTPLLIGVNWLFLTYTLASVCESLNFSGIKKILIASAGMVLYDFILEPVATRTDMWNWKDAVIPFGNYLAWFFISILFQTIVELFRIKTRNPIAVTLILCQVAFFLLLNIFK